MISASRKYNFICMLKFNRRYFTRRMTISASKHHNLVVQSLTIAIHNTEVQSGIMAGNAHFRPYIVDEAGNPVLEIPRSTNTIFYHYETRILDHMPVSGRPHSTLALEKLKEVVNSPGELLRIPGNILRAPKARPMSWVGAPRGEGRYYYVDQYGRTIETTVTRTPNPPAQPVPGGYPVQHPASHVQDGNLTKAAKVAKDKDVVADTAVRVNNAALFARMGPGAVPAPSGGSGSGTNTTGGPGGSGTLNGGGSGMDTTGATGGAGTTLGGGGSGEKSSGLSEFLSSSSLFDF